MKTYEQAVRRLALGEFYSYMNGDMLPAANAGEVRATAFIFGVDLDDLYEQVDEQAVEILKAYRATGNMPEVV